MTRVETLKSLETVLESFLKRAVSLKEERLRVFDGINRLDDIARGFLQGNDLTDQMGGWFAQHNHWLRDQTLRPTECNRIGRILAEIKRELRVSADSSPEVNKISGEIDRWNGMMADSHVQKLPGARLILKRGPETAESVEGDSVALFARALQDITNLFRDFARNKQHLMSVLDEALQSATLQKNKEALILSALVIYYLKQNGYKTEPFVKRLKEAEHLQKGSE